MHIHLSERVKVIHGYFTALDGLHRVLLDYTELSQFPHSLLVPR